MAQFKPSLVDCLFTATAHINFKEAAPNFIIGHVHLKDRELIMQFTIPG